MSLKQIAPLIACLSGVAAASGTVGVHDGASPGVVGAAIVMGVLVVFVVYFAITARARQHALAEANRRINELIENLPGMAYRAANDPAYTIDFVSEGCSALSGYMPEEFANGQVNWGDLIHADDRDRVWGAVQGAKDTKNRFEVEYRIQHRDGDVRWVWERGQCFRDEVSGHWYIRGFINDVSARRQTENSLDEARAFSEAVLETAAEAIITIDEHGTIESFNQAAQSMFGYAPSDVKGRNVKMLMPDPFRSDHDGYISRYLNTNEARIIGTGREVRALRKTGEIFPIHLSVSEVRHQQGVRFVGLIRDISQQRAAEDEAREHRELLAHVDRLTMLGEMATGIAHEINQPLTAISLFSQAGKRLLETGKNDRLPEIFDKLSDHANRAGEIIERMQTMARREERAHEVVDCNALIEEIAMLAETEARIRDIAIAFEPTPDLPQVNVDRVQIQQVALNLLRNGMESMHACGCENGSTITIGTSVREDGDIAIAVVDSGSGVADEILERMFTPFATTKESGMGMGLSISRAIINAHGGELSFKNNDDSGATFFFSLPPANLEVTDG